MSDIRNYPAQGKQYRIQADDTIEVVCKKAYGSEKYIKDLTSTNPALSKNQKTSTGQPAIYPGDILIIPEIRRTLTGRQKLENKEKDEDSNTIDEK